jgi:rod shape-determining protein MreD
MKPISYIMILLLVVPVQTTVIDTLSFHGTKPDLGLIVVYMIGLSVGVVDGILMGLLIGLLMDLFSGGMLGVNLLAKAFVGGGAGLLGRTVLHVRVLFPVVMLFAVSLAAGLMSYLFLQVLEGRIIFREAFWGIILPQSLYDTVLGAVLLGLLPRLWRTRRIAVES